MIRKVFVLVGEDASRSPTNPRLLKCLAPSPYPPSNDGQLLYNSQFAVLGVHVIFN